MPYQPIEEYGIIGNMRAVALVGTNGSINWHCSPNFDSPSVLNTGAFVGTYLTDEPITSGWPVMRPQRLSDAWPRTLILRKAT